MELSLADRDKHVLWHPFTPQKNSVDTIPIARGEGVYLIDEKGNRYIDAISSWWVNLHGHAHSYIAEKIYEQAKKLEHVIFAGFTHEPAVLLAERLLSLLPGNFSKIFYSDDGSTSTEVAIKMALQYWWNNRQPAVGSQKPEVIRNKILALNNSYHGDTFGAMSVSDRGIFTLPFYDKLFEVIFIDPSDESSHGRLRTTFPRGPEDNLQLSTFNLNEIACFIYEPLVQGAGGMKMYDAHTLHELLKVCKEHDIICIADEVMTGFYRTGKLFASEYCEEKPDIICLSKGLTGGTMALGVTACTEKIYNAFLSEDKLKTFFHGHSFTANPLACTAALASLDLLQVSDFGIRIEKIIELHNQFIEQLTTHQPPLITKIKNIRQLGTILAFEVVTGDKDEYLNNISSIVSQKALQHGIYLRPLGNTVYIMPPYCIKEDELKTIYATILDILLSI